MNVISEEKKRILHAAFLEGKTIRAAGKLAGVSKVTANLFRLAHGGMEGYRKRGATFKRNRWK